MLPEMTDEQRAAALERAGLARRTRAEIKALLKTGSLTFTDVMERERTTLLQVRGSRRSWCRCREWARSQPSASWRRSVSPRRANSEA
jgi:hypothetical protein